MRAIVMGAAALAMGAAMIAASPSAAQDGQDETRLGEEGFESPPATLDQMRWLVGQWVGKGIEGAPAMESWLPASSGAMVGTFVQDTPAGGIMFTEHMYLMEEAGSLVLRIKHFNADLTGWEEKDDMLSFRLVAIEPCAAYFNALTLRCANPEHPNAGIVAAVRMKSEGADVQELIFTFDAIRPQTGSYGCDGTTAAINDCLADVLSRSKERHARYRETAIGENAASERLAALIRESDAAFETHREAECGAVYEHWKEGTIRTAMWLRCAIRMTDQRTRGIWQNWLTFQDSSLPILPEPGPSM